MTCDMTPTTIDDQALSGVRVGVRVVVRLVLP
jgi:hypothetical protein